MANFTIRWAAKEASKQVAGIRFMVDYRDIEDDNEELGGQYPPNIPLFLPHSGDSREPN
jgi:hypothetical protein